MGEICIWWSSWKKKSRVEPGAGLALPSIAMSNVSAKMFATDSDDKVLHLLGKNVQRNAPSCRVVKKLFWGSSESQTVLGLKENASWQQTWCMIQRFGAH